MLLKITLLPASALLLGAFVHTLFASDVLQQFPGESLTKGMLLKYKSNQGDSIYKVLDIQTDISVEGVSSCSKLSMSYDGSPSSIRVECFSEGFLFEGKENPQLQKARPIGPNMILEKFDSNGVKKSKFITSSIEVVEVDGKKIKIVNTEVYSFQEDGEIKYRLTEKYAPLYSTATSGKFEVPDSSSKDGWRTTIEFHLEKIEI